MPPNVTPQSLRRMAGVLPPTRLDPARTALLLIDFQREYYDGGLPLPRGEAAAAQAARLVARCDALGATVIHVHHVAASAASALFTPGSARVEPHRLLVPGPHHRRVEKRLPSSFVGTPLAELLRGRGIERLVICGLMTHLCVDSTTRDALSLGFNAVVVADACASRDLPAHDGGVVGHDDVHRATLAALGDRVADILDTAAVLAALDG